MQLHNKIICLLPRFVTFSYYIDDCYYAVFKVVFTGLISKVSRQ